MSGVLDGRTIHNWRIFALDELKQIFMLWKCISNIMLSFVPFFACFGERYKSRFPMNIKSDKIKLLIYKKWKTDLKWFRNILPTKLKTKKNTLIEKPRMCEFWFQKTVPQLLILLWAIYMFWSVTINLYGYPTLFCTRDSYRFP